MLLGNQWGLEGKPMYSTLQDAAAELTRWLWSCKF